VINIIDSIAAIYQKEMVYHCSKWNRDYNSWLSNVENLRDAARRRPDIVKQQLKDWFGYSQEVNVSFKNASSITGQISFDDICSIGATYNGTLPKGTITKVKFIPPQGYKFWKATRKTNGSYVNYFVRSGDIWKYWDKGEGINTNWYSKDYNDSDWNEGPSQLGYGDGDEKTVVSYGGVDTNKFITTYFRKKFNYDKTLNATNFKIRILYDDGAVIYLNGQPIDTLNFFVNDISYSTFANVAADESTFTEISLNSAYLVDGENTIAVEIHQCSATSSDISFDLELLGNISGDVEQKTIYSSNFYDTINTNVEYVAYFQENTQIDGLVINEIAVNNWTNPDEFNEYDEWVELKNISNKPIDLSQLYFSDSIESPYKYKIKFNPSINCLLDPDNYCILWADGQSYQGYNHMNFKISDNYSLYIIQKVGENPVIIDKVNFIKLYGKYTYGRYSDGYGDFIKLCHATFSSENNNEGCPVIVENVLNDKNIMAYFNNHTKQLIVNNINTHYHIMIYDINGELLYKFYLKKYSETINLSNISKGVYFVKVDNSEIFKIVVF